MNPIEFVSGSMLENPDTPKSELRQMFNNLDRDGSKTLSMEEFFAIASGAGAGGEGPKEENCTSFNLG
jgi:Ca2+-binding EF-hand superfamily protein